LPEDRDIVNLTAQMRQDIKDRTIDSIKGLSVKKKKGKSREVGKLKFKSRVSSIPLKQYGMTYKIRNSKYINLQGFRKDFKVMGLNQIPVGAEFANANLVRKASGYYFKITCYIEKVKKELTNRVIGLDFGIKDSIVDSDGNRYNFQFPESKRIKEISRKFNKVKKGTKRHSRLYNQLQKAYEKNTNKKTDARNKFVSKLVKGNDLTVMQDESIKAWRSSGLNGFGRRVQHSILGGIKSDLMRHSETLMVDKWFPSTQLCPECKRLNKIGLGERLYRCECGYIEDRDKHSARNNLNKGLELLKFKMVGSTSLPYEEKTSTYRTPYASEYLTTPEALTL
jgi:transposase